MPFTTEQMTIFIMGIITAAIVCSLHRIIVGVIDGYPTRLSEKQINMLIDSLQRQGFKVYQAIAGHSEMTNDQVREACLLKSQGYLVFSDRDAYSGYLLRPRLTSKENAQIRRSKFKLVVSNEPNE